MSIIATKTDTGHGEYTAPRIACPSGSGCLGVQWWQHPETGEPGMVVLHDTTDPDGPNLEMSMQEWAEFIRGVKEGRFDAP